MDLVKWDDSMSVGSTVFDGHHKIIIDCLNKLHPLLGKANCEAEISEVLAKLEEFVLVHFGEEERVMRMANYPDWRVHKEQHDQMYDLVFKLKTDAEAGRALEAAYVYELVYTWLIRHILGDDKLYGPYISTLPPGATQATRAQ